jgi:VIT1/CCC1 family predicted Fe2+/Mn2+ transporter
MYTIFMSTPQHIDHQEPHFQKSGKKLNWLRAAVLGANDGIVSVAGIVVGVAGATNNSGAILTAGVAGIVAGALSMAAGEYVSVSSQRDTEKALLAKEKKELIDNPEQEQDELVGLYENKGLSHDTAAMVARELSAKDPFAAHVDIELGIDPNDLANPWHAALASTLAFSAGALIPLVSIIFAPEVIRVPVTFGSVIMALIITGTLSAYAGGAGKRRAIIRVLIGGILAMAVTYGIGRLVGLAGI